MIELLLTVACFFTIVLSVLLVFVFDDFVFDRYFTNKLRKKLGINK